MSNIIYDNKQVDWFKYEVFKDTQHKLYESGLVDQFDINMTHDQIYLSDSDMINVMANIPDHELRDIEHNLHKYRLIKSKTGEDSSIPHKLSDVLTRSMQEITDEYRNLITCTYLGIIKTGKLWHSFASDYNVANAFYTKKNKSMPSEFNNLRCLINSHNLLKILQRVFKDNIINSIFENGLVDTNIHQARKCREIINGDTTHIAFEKIAELGAHIHQPGHQNGTTGFIMLDMSNAYNNIKYDFLSHVLTHYLSKIYTPDPDTSPDSNPSSDTNSNPIYAHNIATGITRLIKLTKYWDPCIKAELKRNKGIPQGCPISCDLYIICMDYIFKEIILDLNTNLGLQLGRDYKTQVYVDDILIEIISDLGFQQSGEMLQLITHIFTKYHFKLNLTKSCATSNLATNLGLNVISQDHKYLGIYMESDPHKYLDLIELEFKHKFPRKQQIHTFANMEDNITYIFNSKNGCPNNKIISMVRGKLNYRLTPFAKNNTTRNHFMCSHGYPKLAHILWPL